MSGEEKKGYLDAEERCLNGKLGFDHVLHRPATPEEEAKVTPAYAGLVKMLDTAIAHIKVVGNGYVSGVYLEANMDMEGNISKEETGIRISISAR